MKANVEKSFFIIKPEAFGRRQEIKRAIELQSRLVIIVSKVLRLSENDIESIYLDDINSSVMPIIKWQLAGKRVEVGIVASENAIVELQKVCGESPYPSKCRPGTIRRVFGLVDPVRYNGYDFYLNAIHKSSKSEVDSALRWFLNVLGNDYF